MHYPAAKTLILAFIWKPHDTIHLPKMWNAVTWAVTNNSRGQPGLQFILIPICWDVPEQDQSMEAQPCKPKDSKDLSSITLSMSRQIRTKPTTAHNFSGISHVPQSDLDLARPGSWADFVVWQCTFSCQGNQCHWGVPWVVCMDWWLHGIKWLGQDPGFPSRRLYCGEMINWSIFNHAYFWKMPLSSICQFSPTRNKWGK